MSPRRQKRFSKKNPPSLLNGHNGSKPINGKHKNGVKHIIKDEVIELSSSEKSPLKLYLNDIGKFALLTPEEEIALAKKVRSGNKAAREKMIRANLRLVVKIARNYNNFGLPYLDLISEGNIGLMKAIERFDPNRGGKLSTYAAWWIKQCIKRALANQSKTIRLPVHLIEKLSLLRKTEVNLKNKLKREPTIDELSFAIKLPINKVALLKTVAIKPASLDVKIGNDEKISLKEIVGDENSRAPSEECLDKSIVENIRALVKKLSKREARIITLRFGLNGERPQTLEEVGEALGLTRERVRQLQIDCLKQLRALLECKEHQRSVKEIAQEKRDLMRAKVIKEFIDGINEHD